MNLNCKTKFLCFFTLLRFFLLVFFVSLTVLSSNYLQKSFASPVAIFTVINTNDSGAGSFRQALLDANANPGLDTIVFNIGSGVQTIAVSTGLPRISDPVVIDSTTQPGYTGNPVVELKGTGGSGSSLGLAIDAGNTTIRGLVINNFGQGGIGIFTNSGNRIENNFIGTNITGTAAQANFAEGIRIFNSSNNVIGGTSIIARNLISGNSLAGIAVNGTNNNNNTFQGNYIGTDITGMVAIPNNREGICLCSSNGDFAVSNNLIGGTAPGTGNLISGNRFDEIRISGLAIGNIVQGNLIGTNAAGTQAITSTGYGINLDGARNSIIGGTVAGVRNVISSSIFGSSNGGSGINIERASGNIIQGNFIGTDITGTTGLPNSDWGIRIFENSQNNIIGGTVSGAGNVIAFNGRAGIIMGRPTFPDLPVINNSVRGNSIFFNGELGIDLTDNTGVGVTPNDSCDADTGVNNLQNYPVLALAISNSTTTTITGSLNSTANTTFAIDFFVSPTYDSTNFGEGKTYIGSTNITTADNCNTDFNVTLSYPAAGSQFITATATDSNGNTSEFSQYVRAAGTNVKANFDFDGDGRSDISVFRPSDGTWYLNRSALGFSAIQFGISTDKITPADFDGDGKTDIAVFRNGTWYLQRSTLGFTGVAFGEATDIPMPADYDGDGKADIAVFRPSNGTWYLLRSSQGFTGIQFGQTGDKPVAADYDGDGKADIAVVRQGGGVSIWYILGSTRGFYGLQFGTDTDKPVPADYDGDGKADLAVFRPSNGTWYILGSTQGFYAAQFGIASDIPVAADYDGDGKADIAVYRDGIWYLLRSQQGFGAVQFGTTNDRPIPAAYVP